MKPECFGKQHHAAAFHLSKTLSSLYWQGGDVGLVETQRQTVTEGGGTGGPAGPVALFTSVQPHYIAAVASPDRCPHGETLAGVIHSRKQRSVSVYVSFNTPLTLTLCLLHKGKGPQETQSSQLCVVYTRTAVHVRLHVHSLASVRLAAGHRKYHCRSLCVVGSKQMNESSDERVPSSPSLAVCSYSVMLQPRHTGRPTAQPQALGVASIVRQTAAGLCWFLSGVHLFVCQSASATVCRERREGRRDEVQLGFKPQGTKPEN